MSTKSHEVSKIKDLHDFGVNSKIAKIIKERKKNMSDIEEFREKYLTILNI